MKRLGGWLVILVFFGFGWMRSNQAEGEVPAKAVSVELQPSPEMLKLLDAFGGKLAVSETFEISTSRRGKTRQGVASFRAGPGVSVIEDYRSSGSAGVLGVVL
jgi:hypothetical protein